MAWPRVRQEGLPGETCLPPVDGLLFGDPNGLNKAEKDTNGRILRAYAKANAKLLGFAAGAGPIQACSFHPVCHLNDDGRLFVNMVVELVQTVWVPFDDPDAGSFPMRNGVTLIIVQDPVVVDDRPPPKVLFVIQKLHSSERQRRVQTYYQSTGRSLRKGDPLRFQIDFGLLHAGG